MLLMSIASRFRLTKMIRLIPCRCPNRSTRKLWMLLSCRFFILIESITMLTDWWSRAFLRLRSIQLIVFPSGALISKIVLGTGGRATRMVRLIGGTWNTIVHTYIQNTIKNSVMFHVFHVSDVRNQSIFFSPPMCIFIEGALGIFP